MYFFVLHNLKRIFYFFYNLIAVMRIGFSRNEKRLPNIIKLQLMAAKNIENNESILKAETIATPHRFEQDFTSLPPLPLNDFSCAISKKEDTGNKESIKVANELRNGKALSSVATQFKTNLKLCPNTLNKQQFIYEKSTEMGEHYNDDFWSRYKNIVQHTFYPSRSIQQNSNPIFSRSSNPHVQQHLNYVHLNNYNSTKQYNTNRVCRSLMSDSSNATQEAQRDKQVAWSIRSWQRTELGMHDRNSNSRSTCYFKVMSYNVLAQELLTEHPFLYRQNHPRALMWEQRWINLFQEVSLHQPDILCMQEVQASHLDGYYDQLKKLGYDGIFKQRTGIRTDGCAIYYKTVQFNLIEYTTVEFNQTSIPVLNRDNVAIVAKFSSKSTGSEFVVATTHLLYNPRREDVRLAQTQVLLSEVDRISYKKGDLLNHSHLPMIITGDFNLTPESAVYKLLTQGILDYQHLLNRSLATTNATFVNVTGKTLLPSSLRITDECQHADLVEMRKGNTEVSRKEELKLIQLQHTERKGSNKCGVKFDQSLYSTGTLSHNMALQSAYKHRYNGGVEATTFQNAWVTVDYIFYSGLKDTSGVIKEDKLKLISRYLLPTSDQLRDVKIPNFAFGSDHLSLLVKFKLDP